MKILFIGPRTIQPLDPDCDELVPDHHLSVGSLKSSGLADVAVCYYDDYHRKKGVVAVEAFIVDYCEINPPDLVVFAGLRTEIFRCEEVLPKLAVLGIPTVHLWWDHISPDNRALTQFYIQHGLTLNVVMDIATAFDGESPDHYMNLFYPLDHKIFYPSNLDRDIDVCFMGTVLPGVFQDRVDYLTHLHKQGIKFFSKTGVYGKEPLKIEEYADKLRSSKIGLNFTYMPKFECPHCKTRTFETIVCGAMLLEQDNVHTHHWFEPGVDYVPFDTPEDLEEKIKYYLSHEEERLKIAKHGYETIRDKYTERAFWEKVFEKLGLGATT